MHIIRISLVLAFLIAITNSALGHNRALHWQSFNGGQFNQNNVDLQANMRRDIWYTFTSGQLEATISVWDKRLMRINVYRSGDVELREYCRGSRKSIVSSVNSINVFNRRSDPTVMDCNGDRMVGVNRLKFIETLLMREPRMSIPPPSVRSKFAILTLELYHPELLRRDPYQDRSWDRSSSDERKKESRHKTQ